MKDEITITQQQFNEAVGKAIEDLNEKSKKAQASDLSMASMVSKMLYMIFAAELLIVLFKDEDNLEIEEKN